MVIPLNQVPAGTKVSVVALAGGRGFQQRIVSMGLHIGSEAEVIHASGGGSGPTLVAVGETRLAIGHGMSDKVMVAMDPE
jgi:ferrous iron transport protein A